MQDKAVGTEGDAYTGSAFRGQLQDITGGGFPHDPVMGRAQLVPGSPVILVAANAGALQGKGSGKCLAAIQAAGLTHWRMRP